MEHAAGQAPPYEALAANLAYTNLFTVHSLVDGKQGSAAIDLEFPWIADLTVTQPAVASEDVVLTWTASVDASCSLRADSYLEQDFPDEGQQTIPAGTLQPSATRCSS